MGANALGKTTMMKMIAGVEKPTEGSVDKKIKISYKPQYLSNDIDVDVISVLEKSNGSSMNAEMLESPADKKLSSKNGSKSEKDYWTTSRQQVH